MSNGTRVKKDTAPTVRGHAGQAVTAERDAAIWALRVRGASYTEIAAELAISTQTAHASIRRGLAARAVLPETVESVRALELERLDAWLARLAPRIEQGDDGAIRTALAVGERRSRLLGLDAPTTVQIEGTLRAATDAELDAALERHGYVRTVVRAALPGPDDHTGGGAE